MQAAQKKDDFEVGIVKYCDFYWTSIRMHCIRGLYILYTLPLHFLANISRIPSYCFDLSALSSSFLIELDTSYSLDFDKGVENDLDTLC